MEIKNIYYPAKLWVREFINKEFRFEQFRLPKKIPVLTLKKILTSLEIEPKEISYTNDLHELTHMDFLIWLAIVYQRYIKRYHNEHGNTPPDPTDIIGMHIESLGQYNWQLTFTQHFKARDRTYKLEMEKLLNSCGDQEWLGQVLYPLYHKYAAKLGYGHIELPKTLVFKIMKLWNIEMNVEHLGENVVSDAQFFKWLPNAYREYYYQWITDKNHDKNKLGGYGFPCMTKLYDIIWELFILSHE